MGSKLINCCMPEQVGTKEYGRMIKRIPSPLRMAGYRRRRQETGRLNDKKKSREKDIRGFKVPFNRKLMQSVFSVLGTD